MSRRAVPATPMMQSLESRIQLSNYVLDRATYLGGNQLDEARDIVVDSSGNSLVVGRTFSPNFPTTTGRAYQGAGDAFVAKFNADGSRAWAGDLGGSKYDNAHSVALDSQGNVWVAGETESADFPTSGAIQPTLGGAYDIFIAKFDSSGHLQFSTLLGGPGTDAIRDLAIDANGNAWIAGESFSAWFPGAHGGRLENANNVGPFVVQLAADGSQILSAMATPVASVMALGPSGDIYLAGAAAGAGLATPNAFMQKLQGGQDIYVVRMTAAGTTVFASYLGTDKNDMANDLAVDSAGNVWVAGQSGSVGDGKPYMNGDAAVWELSADGSALFNRVTIGGSALDTADAITIGENDYAYITGRSYAGSDGFPAINAFQANSGGGDDAFVAKIGPAADIMMVSYLGGAGNDEGTAIAVGGDRSIYVAGITDSYPFATTGAFQNTLGGDRDAFVAKLVRPVMPPQVNISESNGGTAVSEGRTADAYTVVLASKPAADVTVTAAPDSQLRVSPATLTFTAENWDIPQSVSVMAVADGITDGLHFGSIGHVVSSADPAYNGLATRSVTVSIEDRPPLSSQSGTATNRTLPTRCAEDDNVNIPISVRPTIGANVVHYAIEASNPTYDIGQDITAADFTNAGPATKAYDYANPINRVLYESDTTVVRAIREDKFWLPQAMTVTVNGVSEGPVHFIALHRRIPGTNSFPQVLVIYADGYIRLKPLPPNGRDDTVFGSSVIVGRAAPSNRPYSEIRALSYNPATDSFHIDYANGDSGELRVADLSRDAIRVEVTLDIAQASTAPVATLRSMFVSPGNDDMANVVWPEASGARHDLMVTDFGGANAPWFRFGRDARSRHNTSNPEVWIGDFSVSEKAPTAAVSAPSVQRTGKKPYTFTVTYTGMMQMKAATVGKGDLQVVGPRKYRRAATLVWRKVSADGRTIVAKYAIVAPGGNWDTRDNGTYTIGLRSGHVSDVGGNFAAAGNVGTFAVRIGGRLRAQAMPARDIITGPYVGWKKN